MIAAGVLVGLVFGVMVGVYVPRYRRWRASLWDREQVRQQWAADPILGRRDAA